MLVKSTMNWKELKRWIKKIKYCKSHDQEPVDRNLFSVVSIYYHAVSKVRKYSWDQLNPHGKVVDENHKSRFINVYHCFIFTFINSSFWNILNIIRKKHFLLYRLTSRRRAPKHIANVSGFNLHFNFQCPFYRKRCDCNIIRDQVLRQSF